MDIYFLEFHLKENDWNHMYKWGGGESELLNKFWDGEGRTSVRFAVIHQFYFSDVRTGGACGHVEPEKIKSPDRLL